jgi:hypothetical protein
VSRAAVTVVLLLAFAAQAASAVHTAACPMMSRAAAVHDGCEHCPPPPQDISFHAVLPECCAVYSAAVETSVSEPVRAPHAASAVSLVPPRQVPAPVAVPLARAALPVSHAPGPPPPPRNLPLLS